MAKRDGKGAGAKASRGRGKSKRKKKTIAAKADRHALYQRAVQDPDTDAATLAKIYRKIRKEKATVLREDFCGTACLATSWASKRKDRRSIGVDLDGPTLAWGQRNNVDPAGPEIASRVQLIKGNVLDGGGPKADITCALNFSYSIFKRRADLLAYFKTARKTLSPRGIFVVDVLGGTEAMGPDENVHDLGEFTYRWEQEYFDPLTHDFQCWIHFAFKDGSKLDRAFGYTWRLWMMPELADLMIEAGFSSVHRLWEKTDRKGEGNGTFFEPKRAENQESWWTYLVAER